jgi:Flp pilus assembly protein TadD
MALIHCPECNKEVSDKAVACPSCAYPLRLQLTASTSPPLFWNWIIVPIRNFAILIFLLWVAGMFFGSQLILWPGTPQSVLSPTESSTDRLSSPEGSGSRPTASFQSSSRDMSEREKEIRTMLTLAMTDGGISHEREIQETKNRIDALQVLLKEDVKKQAQAKDHNTQGVQYLAEGRLPEALHEFEEAYRLAPNSVEVVNNLGYAHLRNSHLVEAEQLLVQTLTLAPGRTNAWANLGQTYALQGKRQEAVACFANGVRFSRNQAVTRQFLWKLTESAEEDDSVKEAAKQTLQLALLQDDGDLSQESVHVTSQRMAPSQEDKQLRSLSPAPVPKLRITATQLYQEYKENEVTADKKYKDKILDITGTVSAVQKNDFGAIVVLLQGKEGSITSHVQCSLADTGAGTGVDGESLKKENSKKAATLKKGQLVTLRGRGLGQYFLEIVIVDCVFIEEAVRVDTQKDSMPSLYWSSQLQRWLLSRPVK